MSKRFMTLEVYTGAPSEGERSVVDLEKKDLVCLAKTEDWAKKICELLNASTEPAPGADKQ